MKELLNVKRIKPKDKDKDYNLQEMGGMPVVRLKRKKILLYEGDYSHQ